MTIKKNLTNMVLAGALALGGTGCGSGPEIKKVADLTGDGITDILVYDSNGDNNLRGNYLFIGQKDGSFIRAKEFYLDKDNKYLKTGDGVVYFFDGQFYKQTINQTRTNQIK